jgi:hypothetical protein
VDVEHQPTAQARAEEAVHEPDRGRGWAVSAPAVRDVHTGLSGAFKQTVAWGWTAQTRAG